MAGRVQECDLDVNSPGVKSQFHWIPLCFWMLASLCRTFLPELPTEFTRPRPVQLARGEALEGKWPWLCWLRCNVCQVFKFTYLLQNSNPRHSSGSPMIQVFRSRPIKSKVKRGIFGIRSYASIFLIRTRYFLSKRSKPEVWGVQTWR